MNLQESNVTISSCLLHIWTAECHCGLRQRHGTCPVYTGVDRLTQYNPVYAPTPNHRHAETADPKPTQIRVILSRIRTASQIGPRTVVKIGVSCQRRQLTAGRGVSTTRGKQTILSCRGVRVCVTPPRCSSQ